MSNSPAQPWRGRCFLQHTSASIPRVDPREQLHTASATPRQKTVAQPSHQSITRLNTPRRRTTPNSCIAACPERCRPAGRRHSCCSAAQDIGRLRQTGSRRGWRRCALGGRKQRGLGTGAVLAILRRPKSIPQGAVRVRRHGDDSVACLCACPVGRDRRQHARRRCGSPTHTHRRPDCCERSQRDTTPHRVSCRLVTALLLAFCCAGHPGRPSVLNAPACSLWCGGRVPNSEAPEPSAPTRALTALDTARVARVDVWLLLALWNHNGKPSYIIE